MVVGKKHSWPIQGSPLSLLSSAAAVSQRLSGRRLPLSQNAKWDLKQYLRIAPLGESLGGSKANDQGEIRWRLRAKRISSALFFRLNDSMMWYLWNITVFSLTFRMSATSFIGRPSASN